MYFMGRPRSAQNRGTVLHVRVVPQFSTALICWLLMAGCAPLPGLKYIRAYPNRRLSESRNSTKTTGGDVREIGQDAPEFRAWLMITKGKWTRPLGTGVLCGVRRKTRQRVVVKIIGE